MTSTEESSSDSDSNSNKDRQPAVTTIITSVPQDWVEISLLHPDKNETQPQQQQQQQAAFSLGQRILQGQCVVLLSPSLHLVTASERHALCQASRLAAANTEPTDFETAGRVRIPTLDAANRAAAAGTFCGTPLPDQADDLLRAVTHRIFAYLDNHSPWKEVVQVLFASDKDTTQEPMMILLTQLLDHDQFTYASREPAINVYQTGGAFAAHQDDESLTVLICLSSPNNDYEGGGTAFWAPRSSSSSSSDATTSSGNNNDKDNNNNTPCVIVRPEAGTVLLFGGTVTHAACAVTAGCRIMAVSSFSRRHADDDKTTTYMY